MTPHERRLHLVAALRANAANTTGMKFDLSGWLASDWNHSPAQNCGTTGCAVGLAMLQPAFNEEGFRYNGNDPKYRNHRDELWTGWRAVNNYFGLTLDQSLDLFSELRAERREDPTYGAEAELKVAERLEALDATLPAD